MCVCVCVSLCVCVCVSLCVCVCVCVGTEGGYCEEPGECQCKPGYSGVDCSK